MKYLKSVMTFFLFGAIGWLGFQVVSNSKMNQEYKRDAAEMNHFKYGLFSVDAWKEQLSQIISDEIDKLYLTRKNEKALKTHLEGQLEILIDKISERIKETNLKTNGGRLKQSLMDSFIDMEDIKKGIPDYATAMLAEMGTPKAEAQIKGMMKEKITKYLKETFDDRPETPKTALAKKYGTEDEASTKKKIAELVLQRQKVISEQVMYMILLSMVIFLLEALNKNALPQPQYILITLTLLILLAVGVTTPMIDMEAKISHLNFVLFDHPITFDNQVLYFQSKSIWDVFMVMITHKELQMKLVGMLLVSFSVLFPILKMFSSLCYYYNYFRSRENKIIQFFVLHSGKWSMSDVVVVAIFMAYIGFNGIINSQLSNLDESTQNLEILTTNGTSLQPGFYLFFSYAILAMFLSGFLKSRPFERKI